MPEAPARGARSQAIRDYLSANPGASPKAVVAALKEQGTEVTEGLVSNIKYGKGSKGKKKAARPKAAKAAAPTEQAGEVPRGARTQAVRDYLSRNPNASPRDVVAALREQGLDVSEGLVSVVKYKKPAPGAAAKRTGREPARGVNGLSAADLMEAKRFVDQIGGFEQARRALELLEQLR